MTRSLRECIHAMFLRPDPPDLRQEIARQILAQREHCAVHPPGLAKPSCWTCGRNGAFTRAARIVLGRYADAPR